MKMTAVCLDKIIQGKFVCREKFDYDITRYDGENEFEYLKRICLIFKECSGYLTEREILSISAEVFSNSKLGQRQKMFLWKNYLKRPEVNTIMYWKLTELEKKVEQGKEIRLMLMQLQ
jgi:hypothetical protein